MLRYDKPSSTCTGYVTEGIPELAAAITKAFPKIRRQADSTYACRSVRGGTAPSLHGVGRAVDIFPRTREEGDSLAMWLMMNASKLQVQEVIWQRRIWSASKPGQGFRKYSGENPHTDHVHTAINLVGAEGGNIVEPPPPPPPPPYRDRENKLVPAMNDGELYFFGTLINVAILGLAGYGAYQLIQGK